ncbi:hypothetical protein NUH88_15565 [Nisaea acidiphila]|uniref:Lipoprotein n=1 Tax=Nisaea acidiphila TaxID=1862145 RepID=A0A9J7APH0_9PROT|nr:hypothetical protein [Nisaea acidiphila]UUX48818.1 hypothetical protein NUH88_15565 [Nisaea acidiphila]
MVGARNGERLALRVMAGCIGLLLAAASLALAADCAKGGGARTDPAGGGRTFPAML